MWSARDAERRIHRYAKDDQFELAYKRHAEERIEERGIIISDVLHILKNGFVDDVPKESSRKGFYIYKICGKTPNSGSRTICLVVIPDLKRSAIKIITAMWKDLR